MVELDLCFAFQGAKIDKNSHHSKYHFCGYPAFCEVHGRMRSFSPLLNTAPKWGFHSFNCATVHSYFREMEYKVSPGSTRCCNEEPSAERFDSAGSGTDMVSGNMIVLIVGGILLSFRILWVGPDSG